MTKCTVSCDWMNTCDRYCEESRMIGALKKKAGDIGGNAVIITQQWKKDLPYTFHTLKTGFVTGVTTTHYLKGKVIRLPDQK